MPSALFALAAAAQTAKEVKGTTPLVAVPNEAPAKLIVDPPIPEQLALGRVFIQYRTENLRILPVYGNAALAVSPRLGHLHYYVDGQSWPTVDSSGETVVLVGLQPGPAQGQARIGGCDAQTDSRRQPGRGVHGSPSQVAERDCMDRRCFLGRGLITSAFAHLGTIRTAAAAPREFSALGRAVDWINSPPLTPERLAGKVVLVNFWTYTCINWLRTLPYVRAWAQKYQQQFVVVGVHTPEFAFEHNIDNVRRAVRQMHIEYPVAIDNDYSIWRAFDNHNWPALYFVDARGRVRGHRFGEGKYDQSERLIQRVLAEAGAAEVVDNLVPVDASGVESPADWSNLKSPENYLGYQRTENFASPGGAVMDRRRLYRRPRPVGAQSMGAGWRLDRGQTGRRPQQSQRPDGVPLRARLSSRHGTATARRLDAIPRRDRRAAARLRRRRGRGRWRQRHGRRTAVVSADSTVEAHRGSPVRGIEFLDAGVETFAFTFG